ncbi:glycosyltransferase family 4 protein [Cetobacterium somerae]|uniref:glycosyltransferase family 4 protein n=1 Tax=Cetobacterium somerae TaxID=188913 RepID=UPI002256968B|nr:glycosyltransferase family 4 protein [Cetobacterium somerae]MCX3068152.1 glycosyltransferase family 4 protein [Cetobacterium somerae]
MKKILLITTKYGDTPNNKWLTNELCLEFKERGYDVYALVLSWLPMDLETTYRLEEGIKVFRYKLPKIFYGNNKILKAIKMLLFPLIVKSKIKKQFKDIKFDMTISSTPCITLNGLTKFFKKKDKAFNYLILWDFFPYYLLDLNLISKGIKFKIFYEIERRMYNTYDRIGCMTKKNIDFLVENYRLKKDNVNILPLWAEIKNIEKVDKNEIRRKYNVSEEKVVFVYGGAMSVVQKLENILNAALELKNEENIEFLLIGKGTESERIKKLLISEKITNVKFLDYIPREDYEKLLGACDVGIVSLSEKLNVPSFPSKTIDYFKVGLPIIAAIDNYTDYGIILQDEIKGGEYSIANDTKNLVNKIKKLYLNKEYREKLGENGNKYYIEQFNVKKAASIIERDFEKWERI